MTSKYQQKIPKREQWDNSNTMSDRIQIKKSERENRRKKTIDIHNLENRIQSVNALHKLQKGHINDRSEILFALSLVWCYRQKLASTFKEIKTGALCDDTSCNIY